MTAIRAGSQIPTRQIDFPANCKTVPGSVYSPYGANVHADNCVTISGTGLPVANPNYTGAMQGPTLNSSTNTQINVMAPPYNATGDCSTNDHDAILSALLAANTLATSFTLAASVYFPKPPGGCYLTSTLPWYGVSLSAQPGGGGNLLGRASVVIRGMPGQDIFAAPDPSTTAATYPWNGSWTIENISFLVDGSATASFPHSRWPGRWFDSVVTTSGSTNIAITTNTVSCGDVGQAIQINGAGAGGTNLVTTIAAVNPCVFSPPYGSGGWRTITLAAPAQASLSNAHTYISLLGLPVTATIGPCALAFPEYDALQSDWVNPAAKFGQGQNIIQNVLFGSVHSGTNACAIYSQGHQSPYQFKVELTNFQQLDYGVVEGTSELNSAQASSGNDFQTWNHIWMFGMLYPWISYNGGGNQLTNWQLAAASGPQILQSPAVNGDCACGWKINTGGFEITGPNTGYGERIEGSGHELQGASLTVSGMVGSINGTAIYGYAGSGGGTVNLTGSNIRIDLGQGQADPSHFVDSGIGNSVHGTYNGSGPTGLQSPYQISMLPYKGETQLVGRTTAQFLRDGNYTTPYNWDDLMFWPEDFVLAPFGGGPSYSQLYIPDTASPTGAEIQFTNSIFLLQFQSIPYNPYNGTTANHQQLTVGTNLPATTANWYFMAKCPAGITSFSFSIKDSTNSVRSTTSGSCSTTLQVYKGPKVDFTALTGNQIGFIGGNALPNSVLVAWVAIMPDPATTTSGGIANIQITTGTTPVAANSCTANTPASMTGVATTSAIIPPTPTSSTTGVTGWGSSGGLGFSYYVTANTFNWSICNPTSASINPGGSITWNVGAR